MHPGDIQGGSTWDVKVSWLSADTDVRCITSVATDPVHDYYHHPSFGLVKLLNRSLFGGRIGYIQKRFSAFSSYDVATYHSARFLSLFRVPGDNWANALNQSWSRTSTST
jgi:hypothetical protein